MFPCVIPTEWVEPPDLDSDAIRSPSSTTQSTSSAVSCSSKTPLKSTSAGHQRAKAYGSSEASVRSSLGSGNQTQRRPCASRSYPTSRQSSTASVEYRQYSTHHHHRRRSSVPSILSRRLSGDRESIILIRPSSPLIEDEFNIDNPVKEPDCYRPEVLRSATQLSIDASLKELDC
ncbi:hypothetical protein DFQ28_006908 [Apophysomyces sp. BC1034]|nr:hypothetical protein DFQ29_007681 [Apophysomyces sp. BC1021]KAG0187088.1 hypothetical protein DFQ28_006908 [Apophysomyces sp. BC1034]